MYVDPGDFRYYSFTSVISIRSSLEENDDGALCPKKGNGNEVEILALGIFGRQHYLRLDIYIFLFFFRKIIILCPIGRNLVAGRSSL